MLKLFFPEHIFLECPGILHYGSRWEKVSLGATSRFLTQQASWMTFQDPYDFEILLSFFSLRITLVSIHSNENRRTARHPPRSDQSNYERISLWAWIKL